MIPTPGDGVQSNQKIMGIVNKGIGTQLLCNQCSIDEFGVPFGDLEDEDIDPYGIRFAYCRICGWTILDKHGTCLMPHHKGKKMKVTDSEYVEQYDQIIERFFGPNSIKTEDVDDKEDTSDEE